MKEVRCILVSSEDWRSSEHSFVPLRVLVPEVDGDKPENNVHNVLNYLRREDSKDIPSIDTLITKTKGELASRLWDSVDWDSAPLIDPKPSTPGEAWGLFTSMSSYRVKELEPLIAQDDSLAERYMNRQPKSGWKEWEDEELERSPAFLFMYAQQVMKGRLPEHLHAAMVMHSYRDGDNFWVKKYFKARRYKYHCKKNLRAEERFMLT